MIVEVFVAKSDAKDSLSQHGFLLMDCIEGIAWVWDAIVDGVNQAEMFINLSQEQCTCIGDKAAAVEIGLNFLALEA